MLVGNRNIDIRVLVSGSISSCDLNFTIDGLV